MFVRGTRPKESESSLSEPFELTFLGFLRVRRGERLLVKGVIGSFRPKY